MPLALLRPFVRVLPLTSTLAVAAGGWAVITLDDLPDAVTAGRPITLTFTVRQHGRTPLDNLHPSIEAAPPSGGDHVRADAVPAGGTGRYRSTLTLPDTGSWRLTINSGFGPSHVDLDPISVMAPGQVAPAAAAAQRGRRLFVAKGCVTCHLHGDVPGSGVVQVGPELTTLRVPPDFLGQFLADPSILPPAQGSTVGMPNLGLKPAEITALVAFLDATSETARAGQ